MPIYEYRCPRGHTFELLQGVTDDPPPGCQVCGASPIEKVLYPAAIHFKGSGFYSTDYGRAGAKAESGKDGGDSKDKSGSDKSTPDSKADSSKKKKKEEKG